MHPITIIPARLAATRLPGKPLADICGTPMILHVVRRALAANLSRVVVAAGDAAIAAVVRDAGYEAVLTDPALPSGTDRVCAALRAVDPERAHDVVINLQGDLPTLPPGLLAAVLTPLREPWADIATLAAPITDAAEAASDSMVKVACAFELPVAWAPVARALYFSRAQIPWGDGPMWHHIGLYAFRRAALERFVARPPSPLERREKLEQLRALEAGMAIGVARVDAAPLGVDTPEDLARVRVTIAQQHAGMRATMAGERG